VRYAPRSYLTRVMRRTQKPAAVCRPCFPGLPALAAQPGQLQQVCLGANVRSAIQSFRFVHKKRMVSYYPTSCALTSSLLYPAGCLAGCPEAHIHHVAQQRYPSSQPCSSAPKPRSAERTGWLKRVHASLKLRSAKLSSDHTTNGAVQVAAAEPLPQPALNALLLTSIGCAYCSSSSVTPRSRRQQPARWQQQHWAPRQHSCQQQQHRGRARLPGALAEAFGSFDWRCAHSSLAHMQQACSRV
jgi:hypothetical protein